MTTQSKVALVTGANKGIGFEIARGLAAGGFTVAAAARDAQLGRRSSTCARCTRRTSSASPR
jgi:NAD(P)-dependent dehydrogenase (short-subunit alcohol dehydrogenase family)